VHVDLLLDPFGARWTDLRDAAHVAVDSGFGGIWTYDHVDGRVYDAAYVLESWTVLSGLAATVPGALLGPLVLNVANRHPGVLAAMAATLQEVSGGRLLLGLGAGASRDTPYAREQETIGLPVLSAGQRRANVIECVAELRRLWRAPGFLQPDPEPPVVIAAFGARMAELAGRVGDGINTRATHPKLPELLAIARAANADAGGEPDRFLITVFTDFDESWLAMDPATQPPLANLGIDRLVLALRGPFDRRRIAAAGRLLPG
jgi:alkanesulfonate monooxygenase SsuD/methylene tetrahydromethanopterin reductase-like flavin-dependent oxidoreductase (luciferase family)